MKRWIKAAGVYMVAELTFSIALSVYLAGHGAQIADLPRAILLALSGALS